MTPLLVTLVNPLLRMPHGIFVPRQSYKRDTGSQNNPRVPSVAAVAVRGPVSRHMSSGRGMGRVPVDAVRLSGNGEPRPFHVVRSCAGFAVRLGSGSTSMQVSPATDAPRRIRRDSSFLW
jgi:hypothetical protein